MRNSPLALRKVRRYRKARYPSRHPTARRAPSLRQRVLRGAAAPAVALGLGAAAGACDGDVSLAGDDPDASDAVAPDDAAPDLVDDPDSILGGEGPSGTYYLRYLTEAEGRALIAETIAADTTPPANPCEEPVLADRVLEDQPFVRLADDGTTAARASIDILAPEIHVEVTPECPAAWRASVGFEFATDEAGDDEDVSGNPDGLTDAEEAALASLRESRAAAVAVIRSSDHPYDVWDYGAWVEDYDRANAEEEVRQAVRNLIADLRRDGML
ncbi:MAG: hypothetical protein HY905_26590 [Deltaproteobacteria bacterium]|nr:hypothetical protein [Deltaproteobacteria bacterium]